MEFHEDDSDERESNEMLYHVPTIVELSLGGNGTRKKYARKNRNSQCYNERWNFQLGTESAYTIRNKIKPNKYANR